MLNNDTLENSLTELASAVTKLRKEIKRRHDLPGLSLACGLMAVENLKKTVGSLTVKLLARSEVRPGEEKDGEQSRLFGKDAGDDSAA